MLLTVVVGSLLVLLAGGDGCLSFMNIPGTAGAAVENLEPGWGSKDKELQCTRKPECIEKSVCPCKHKCQIFHIPPSADPEVALSYSRCETFCVVRHPLGRLVDGFMQKRSACSVSEFHKYVLHMLQMTKAAPYNNNCVNMPQVNYVYAEGRANAGRRHCQHVLRYENVSAEFNELMRQLGRPTRLDESAAPQAPCVMDVSTKLQRQVWEFYRADFQAFGYAPPDLRPPSPPAARASGAEPSCLSFMNIPNTSGEFIQGLTPSWEAQDQPLPCTPGEPPGADPAAAKSGAGCETFCVVRHPLYRLLQYYLQPGRLCDAFSFALFVRDTLARATTSPWLDNCQYRPQVRYTRAKSGRPCQHLLRFENLTAEFNGLMQRFGKPMRLYSVGPPLGDCSFVVPHEVQMLVWDFYRADYEALGYAMPAEEQVMTSDLQDNVPAPALKMKKGVWLQSSPKSWRCVNFLHIPKTAGTSIEGLAPGWGMNDHNLKCVEGQRTIYGKCRTPCSLWHVPPTVDPVLARSYSRCTTFCVVRHPLDKLLSQYFFAKNGCSVKGFTGFVRDQWNNLRFKPFHTDCHFVPQVAYVFDYSRPYQEVRQHCQTVLRYENLTEELKELLHNTSKGQIELVKHSYKSQHSNCSMVIPEEVKAMVRELYSADYHAFGYT